MPSPEEIKAAKDVLNLKASGKSTDAAKKVLSTVGVNSAKKALASNDPESMVRAANEAGEEPGHGISVIGSLGYDDDDNEHFEINVNGKKIKVLEEPDRTLHAVGGKEVKALFDHHYDDIEAAVVSHHQSKGAETAHTTHNESAQITNFIKALSQKNYAAANKYLQGVVESKLKKAITKAYNK
jgi:hypothetical protein